MIVERTDLDHFLGCDPSSLQQHLAKLNPSLNASFFNYVFTLLTRHPAIQLILTTYPFPDATGAFIPGTAPLPLDFSGPHNAFTDVNHEASYRDGLNSRQLAFQSAAELLQTDRKALREESEVREKMRREGKKLSKRPAVDENGAGPSNYSSLNDQDSQAGDRTEGLIRMLGEDDGDAAGQKVVRTDLRGLMEKWGSRFRIRCTDNEIYFRLVGSNHKVCLRSE